MSKPIDIVLPADAAGCPARLERWLLNPGDPVEADAPVAEIETDKVTLEVAAAAAGVLREALIEPGQDVTPGAVLGRIEPLSAEAFESVAASITAEIRFPDDQTEGTTATLTEWLVEPGQAVGEGEPVAEIETDKVTIEVTAPVSGVLKEVRAAAGDALEPGAVLGTMAPAAPVADTSDIVPAPVKTARKADRDDAEERLSPAVRRLMAQHGLSTLKGIEGSGEGGRVTRDDLLDWLGQRPRIEVESPASEIPSRRVPHSNMRRAIARHMADSLSRAPHVTSVFEADLGAIVRHRVRHRQALADQGVKLTYTAYFMAAAARAMRVVPEVNGRFHDDALEIFDEVNIGIGTALGSEGLVVPVVRGVERLDLDAIARKLHDKTERARAGSLTQDDLRDGTFTISNHGVSGSLLAAPIIINQPQVAILGIGKLEKRLQVFERDGEDKVRIRPMCYVTLSIDHRALDADQTNRWLSAFVNSLESWPIEP